MKFATFAVGGNGVSCVVLNVSSSVASSMNFASVAKATFFWKRRLAYYFLLRVKRLLLNLLGNRFRLKIFLRRLIFLNYYKFECHRFLY